MKHSERGNASAAFLILIGGFSLMLSQMEFRSLSSRVDQVKVESNKSFVQQQNTSSLQLAARLLVPDLPDQPAPSWGELTYRRMAEVARAQAAGLDALGVGLGERVAVVSHNSARLPTPFIGVRAYGPVLGPVPLNVTDDTSQVMVSVDVATAVGGAKSPVTVAVVVLVQPDWSMTVTVYVPTARFTGS